MIRCIKLTPRTMSDEHKAEYLEYMLAKHIEFFTRKQLILDYNGTKYNTVIIGNQEWTVENLRTTKYNDGTNIPNVTDSGTWAGLTTGAYAAPGKDESNVATYGYLYNWYAVGTGKLAPAGWRVPSDEDWYALITAIGGPSGAGMKLKATSGWNSNGNGTDDYAFSALPGGNRYGSGFFNVVGDFGYWWSASADGTNAWYRFMHGNDSNVYRFDIDKRYGFSVRLVRDVGP